MLSDTQFCDLSGSIAWSLNPCSNGICSLTLILLSRCRPPSQRLNPCSNGICSLTSWNWRTIRLIRVLILVLMEYALWHKHTIPPPLNRGWVLILVLMEYALWPQYYNSDVEVSRGLNPCSNGICSLTNYPSDMRSYWPGLNPCSNGICSLTTRLIVVDINRQRVLILVLMEYALWPVHPGLIFRDDGCLNPCSNGICSLTATFITTKESES